MTNNDFRQQQQRWQYMLGQAFLAASASLLFVTTKSSWSIFGVDFFVIFGIILFIFSIFLMVSALGTNYRRLEPFLAWIEQAANWLWPIFALVSFATLISAWTTGKLNIEKTSWLYGPYDWSVPIWLIMFTVVLIIVGYINPIIHYARNNGWRVTIRRYSLLFAFGFACLALVSLFIENSFSTQWIITFQSLTVIFIIVRLFVRN